MRESSCIMRISFTDTCHRCGAVVRGLGGNQVGQRIARCHYVVTFVEEYNSRLHSARDKYWDAVTETWCVDGRMKWYIEKGKPISEDEPIRMSWHQHVSKSRSLRGLHLEGRPQRNTTVLIPQLHQFLGADILRCCFRDCHDVYFGVYFI
ncbi:uncharacterized protein AFUA_2G00550 [Aspergillus fumigatus Af293]|uniref:Uncharacterized protein n=2 Tax=Aspergillus fumigatus TaxID=746128 RepID=Q4WIV1_ASPFU|nr:conserved hypothetical protein [Aspergillus fumigatus Af293]EAL87154.1 conserved hypothetical protein [Aspergillus fumigatus Af293]EDP53720.1 conserved hypothetical protein [Aspergillus fumigatus A1163]